MVLLLIGLCVVLFDVNLAAGNAYIGIFPDMIGYALMVYVLRRAQVSTAQNEKILKWCRWAAWATAAVYAAALLGIASVLEGWLWIGLDLVCFVMESYVGYLIVAQMRDHEQGEMGKKLVSAWRVSVLFGAVAYCSVLSPASTLLLMGFSAVADISFLAACFRNAKRCALV